MRETRKTKKIEKKVEIEIKIEESTTEDSPSVDLPYSGLPPINIQYSLFPKFNVEELAKLLLMITNSGPKETIPSHLDPPFHFDWNTTLKDDYELMDKLNSPQYTNLTSTSPSSSSDTKNLALIQVPKLQQMQPTSGGLNRCTTCGYPIVDREISVIDNKSYHHNCLRCSMCDTTFGFSDKCYMRDGAVLCGADHAKRYQKRCVKCEVPLNRDDMVMKARDLIFHHACFVCFVCGCKLNPGDYYTMSAQGHLYCHAHYNMARATVLCDDPVPTVVSSVPLPPPPQQTTPQEPPPREPSTEAEASSDEESSSTPHQRSKRMRTSFKHHQLRAMKTYFALNHNPDAKDLKQLAAKTNLTKRVLQVWFQNARAKYRRGLQDNGRGSSPLCVTAQHSTMDLNPPLSSSSSGHSTDGASYQLNTPPLSNEIYSPNNNYTHL